MLKKLFKKDFTNENFFDELMAEIPREHWLQDALLSRKVDINHTDEKNNTFLMLALKKSKYKAALWLIDNEADPTIPDRDDKTVIDIAILKDQIEIVKELLNLQKLDINQKDKYGRSLLQNIIVSGNHDMAELLINCGADINTLDNKGKHIIYDALSYGDPVFVQELLQHKHIELNHLDEDGNTLMQHPQIEQNDNLAKNLLLAGSDPTILNAKGESYLYKTALRGAEAYELIDIALEQGANVNARTLSHNTIMIELIHRALEIPNKKDKMRQSYITIVNKMLQYDGNINAINSKGESALFEAVNRKDLEIIRFLIEENIDLNIQNTKGETVLEKLVYTGLEHADIIKLLIKHNINPRLKNKKGQTVYEILNNLVLHKERNLELEDKTLLPLFDPDALYINVVHLLLENEKVEDGKEYILELFDSVGDPLFFKPLMNDNFALFSLYTKYKINIHQLNKQQYNIFFAYVVRIFENNIDTSTVCKNFQTNVSSLMSRKIDKNFKDSLGWSILHKVVSTKCNIKLFKILTDVVRFDYTLSDNLGRTVIHNAVWQDNKEVIKIVHAHNPKIINVEDIYGITPLYYAALLGNQSLVSQFFDLGANITISGKINPKAIKKFKPMLKNLPTLKLKLEDLSLTQRMDSLIKEIESKFAASK